MTTEVCNLLKIDACDQSVIMKKPDDMLFGDITITCMPRFANQRHTIQNYNAGFPTTVLNFSMGDSIQYEVKPDYLLYIEHNASHYKFVQYLVQNDPGYKFCSADGGGVSDSSTRLVLKRLKDQDEDVPLVCFVNCDVSGFRGFQLIRNGSKNTLELNDKLAIPSAYLFGLSPTHFDNQTLEHKLTYEERQSLRSEIESLRDFFYIHQRLINFYEIMITKNVRGSLTLVDEGKILNEFKEFINHFSKQELCLLPTNPSYFTFIDKLSFYEACRYVSVHNEITGLDNEMQYALPYEYVHKFCKIINEMKDNKRKFSVTYFNPHNILLEKNSFENNDVQILQTDCLSSIIHPHS